MPEKKNSLLHAGVILAMQGGMKMPEPHLPSGNLYDEASFNIISSRVDENMKRIKSQEDMKREARIRHRADRMK